MDRPLADLVWHEGGTASYDGMFEGTGAEFLDWVWIQHEALSATRTRSPTCWSTWTATGRSPRPT